MDSSAPSTATVMAPSSNPEIMKRPMETLSAVAGMATPEASNSLSARSALTTTDNIAPRKIAGLRHRPPPQIW